MRLDARYIFSSNFKRACSLSIILTMASTACWASQSTNEATESSVWTTDTALPFNETQGHGVPTPTDAQTDVNEPLMNTIMAFYLNLLN